MHCWPSGAPSARTLRSSRLPRRHGWPAAALLLGGARMPLPARPHRARLLLGRRHQPKREVVVGSDDHPVIIDCCQNGPKHARARCVWIIQRLIHASLAIEEESMPDSVPTEVGTDDLATIIEGVGSRADR